MSIKKPITKETIENGLGKHEILNSQPRDIELNFYDESDEYRKAILCQQCFGGTAWSDILADVGRCGCCGKHCDVMDMELIIFYRQHEIPDLHIWRYFPRIRSSFSFVHIPVALFNAHFLESRLSGHYGDVFEKALKRFGV